MAADAGSQWNPGVPGNPPAGVRLLSYISPLPIFRSTVCRMPPFR